MKVARFYLVVQLAIKVVPVATCSLFIYYPVFFTMKSFDYKLFVLFFVQYTGFKEIELSNFLLIKYRIMLI